MEFEKWVYLCGLCAMGAQKRAMKKETILLLLLAAINFTHILDFMIVMPLSEVLMQSFGISPRQFGFVVSAYTFSAGLSGFASAFVVDRFDRKQVLMVVYAGFIVGTVFCGMAWGYVPLLVARGVTGVFGGILGALTMSVAVDIFAVERRGYAMGILTASFSVASVVGVPFGLFLATTYSWHTPFYAVAVLSGVLMFFLVYLMPNMRGHIEPIAKSLEEHLIIEAKPSGPFDVLMNIVRDPNQVLALLLIGILVFGHFMIIPFITPFLVRNVGLTMSDIPYMYMFGGVASVISSPIVGRITDRMGGVGTFRIMLPLSLIPVFAMTHLPVMGLAGVLVVTSCFFVLGSGRMVPAQTLVTGAVSARSRGSFMSIRSSVQQLATAAASLIGGVIVSDSGGKLNNYDVLGFIAIGVLLLSLLVAPRIKHVA